MSNLMNPAALALLIAAATLVASQAHAQATPATPVVKLSVEKCADGVDNDGDGKVDCGDPACRAFPACRAELCSNGKDDDGDGEVDCADSECADASSCDEGQHCLDGRDNDGDDTIDCADDDCSGGAECGVFEVAKAKAEAEEAARKSLPLRRLAASQALATARKTLAQARKGTDAKEIGEAFLEVETLTALVKELGYARVAPVAKKVAPAATPAPATQPTPTPAPVATCPAVGIPTAQSGFRDGTR